MLPTNPSHDQGTNSDPVQPNSDEGAPQERPSGLTRRRAQHRRELEIVEEIEEQKARRADEDARKLAEAVRPEPAKEPDKPRDAERPGPEPKGEKDRT